MKRVLVVLAFAYAAMPFGVCAQDAPPDILFIAVDDLNDWVGFLGGHPQVQTPNIDRLAARGMAFTNAHSPSALCNPSRTALLTGLRPSTTGIYGNAPDWRTADVFRSVPTLPRYFRDRGYRTLGAGKIFHAHTFGPDGFAGFNDRTAWDDFYPSIDRQLPDEVGPPRRPANGSREINGFDWAAVVVDDEAMGDGQVANWAMRQLAAETDAPRFVAVGLYRPHLPWYVPQKYFDLYPLENVQLPAVLENDLDDVPPAGHAGHFQARESHEWILQEQKWPDAVQAYLASITFVDTMVGELIDALDRSGRADRTVVVLWGDHGYHLGEKSRWHKMSLWEESTRVPLIVVAPGVDPDSTSAKPVSLMDMYPTLAELASFAVPSHVEGRSLMPLLEDSNAAWEYPAVTTYGYNNHAVRSERYRYIRYADGTDELYDHHSDPNEWTNLAGDPNLRGVKAELAAWMPAQNAPDLAPPRPGR
jgi:choline-sulfatase